MTADRLVDLEVEEQDRGMQLAELHRSGVVCIHHLKH